MKARYALYLRWILFVILVALIGVGAGGKIAKNSAYLVFSRTMVANHIGATERQAALDRFAEFISPAGMISAVESSSEETMLPSIFIAEYHRLKGDMAEAAQWYRQAARSEPEPTWQHSLLYAQRDRLLPDGSILIDDFQTTGSWKPDLVNNNVEEVVFESQDRIACLSYPNHPDRRDIVAYSLYPEGGVELGYHTTLALRVRIEPGSFLTLETKVDDVLERHLNYHEGTGSWETVMLPLEGEVLQAIKVSASEPGTSLETADTYTVELGQIRLELSLQ
jgi:hypothetical protein